MSPESDVSAYPNSVLVQLEMRAHSLRGLRTLLGVRLSECPTKDAKPQGLLHHEKTLSVGFPGPRLVMHWYWRDTASLDAWTREVRYVQWWVDLVSNTPGTSIRAETHRVRGSTAAVPAAEDRLRVPQGSAPVLS